MLVASIPAKFSIPWANSAGGTYINAIPTASQIGITAGAASLTDGFPPTTMQTGGTPPAGPDFNGILKWVTQWGQWQAAGGPVAYDSTFQTAVSGYPLGAVVASATTFGVSWMSTVDGNTTNPDTGGAGWVKIKGLGPYAATDTGTANALAINVPAISALAAGQLFSVKKSSAANTGACAMIVTGSSGALASTSVVWPDGSALAAGDWPASVTALLEYDGTQFNVLSVMGPSVFARNLTAIAPSYIAVSGPVIVPAGATGADVSAYGPGGGGGGVGSTGNGTASGGGGGGRAFKRLSGLVPGTTLTATIGAAGAAGAAGATGGAGGNTSLAGAGFTTITANGGAGGTGNGGSVGGAGGTASGGDLNSAGGTGGAGMPSGTIGMGGMGGGCSNGGAGGAGASGPASNGNFPGGGGGGSGSYNVAAGGAGAAGLITIQWR